MFRFFNTHFMDMLRPFNLSKGHKNSFLTKATQPNSKKPNPVRSWVIFSNFKKQNSSENTKRYYCKIYIHQMLFLKQIPIKFPNMYVYAFIITSSNIFLNICKKNLFALLIDSLSIRLLLVEAENLQLLFECFTQMVKFQSHLIKS